MKAEEEKFEDHLQALEEIVASLEDGNLALHIALAQYKKGMAHLKKCMDFLQEAERTIEVLTRDEEGALKREPFAGEATFGQESDEDG